MLLIQNISLSWHKNERGSECAKVRHQFPMAYPLDEIPLFNDVAVHHLSFFQRGKIFLDSIQDTRLSLEKYLPKLDFTYNQIQNEIKQRIAYIKKYQFQFYNSVSKLNLTNLYFSPCIEKDGFEVSFFYDERRSGKPFRRGHNKDYHNLQSPLYHIDCLNETAFILKKNQYGRILWNERRIDYDTGEWYYQLHIYNMIYLLDKISKNDIFVSNKPDFIYRQEAVLY